MDKYRTGLSRIKVLILCGPTASGKTELLDAVFGRGAAAFSAANATSGAAISGAVLGKAEVISADSMQVYRGMDIGTAKPDPAFCAGLPHHLIDIRTIDEQYTAGDFVTLADASCKDVAARGRLPVVAGGTGFYLRNFICGLPASPPADPCIRGEVARDLTVCGIEALQAELAAADPLTAARIAPRDIYRLTRAVEILRASGRPPCDFAPSSSPRDGYDFLILGIERPREVLYQRIDARVDAMLAAGLPDEVARLQVAGYTAASPGMSAIGYREFFAMPCAPLPDIAAAIKQNTRRYAKRQITFFRALPSIRWIPPDEKALRAAVEAWLASGQKTAH